MAIKRHKRDGQYEPMTALEMSRAQSAIKSIIDQFEMMEICTRMQCTPSYIYKMQREGWLPDRRAVDFHHAFGVPLSILRPDLWGPEIINKKGAA